jgi:hypothetical protein
MEHIKEFEKAAKIYKRIQDMDAEIIRIEALAQKVAEGTLGITIEMKAEKEPEVVESSVINQELNNAIMGVFTVNFGYGTYTATPKQNFETVKEWISEPFALRILAFIMEDKKAKRDTLIRQLQTISEKIQSGISPTV